MTHCLLCGITISMSRFIISTLLIFASFYATTAFAQVAAISIMPENILQGEPAMISIDGLVPGVTVQELSISGKIVPIFKYQSRSTGLIGIDLNKKPGIYVIVAMLSNGQILTKNLIVIKREKYEAPLGIPKSLGGNSTSSQNALVTSLVNENAILSNLKTGQKAFWTQKFLYPVAQPYVTDEYGYSRQTGSYNIAHKGTDFRAPVGTSVVAMNRGVVRIARPFRVYGNTVVIDHGLGVMTMYMHLSNMNVREGHLVQQGQVIGKSGNTGYAEGAHLHLSIRINTISIDPMKFIEFFK